MIELEGVSVNGEDFWVDRFYVSVSNSSAEDTIWTNYTQKDKTVEVQRNLCACLLHLSYTRDIFWKVLFHFLALRFVTYYKTWNTNYKYHSNDMHFQWKIQWRLKLWGALGIMGVSLIKWKATWSADFTNINLTLSTHCSYSLRLGVTEAAEISPSTARGHTSFASIQSPAVIHGRACALDCMAVTQVITQIIFMWRHGRHSHIWLFAKALIVTTVLSWSVVLLSLDILLVQEIK